MNDKKIKSAVLQLLAEKNYITYNKVLAKTIGLEATIVFGELSSISNIYGTDDFFCLKEQIENDTCLNSRAVRLALKTLQDIGLISIIKKGCPCKNYYTLHTCKLLEILSDAENDSSSDVKNDSSSGAKSDTTSDIKNDTTSGVKSDTTFKENIRENIRENINNKSFSKDAIEISQFLYNSCQENDSKFFRTERQLDQWTSDIEKLNRIDKRDYVEIWQVMKWCRNNTFWKPNIMSGSKFRQKYEMLLQQMKNDKRGNPNLRDYNKHNEFVELMKRKASEVYDDEELKDVPF